jgi:hypothetical protein
MKSLDHPGDLSGDLDSYLDSNLGRTRDRVRDKAIAKRQSGTSFPKAEIHNSARTPGHNSARSSHYSDRMPPEPYCPKITYTLREAIAAIRDIRKTRRSKRREIRIYRCNFCGDYHLTSKRKNK